jgi:hypothetical protein
MHVMTILSWKPTKAFATYRLDDHGTYTGYAIRQNTSLEWVGVS